MICTLPKAVPLEFNHLQNLSLYMLKNRLVLLHHFSNVFCKSLPLFNLSQLRISTSDGTECDLDLDHLRCILFLSAKVLIIEVVLLQANSFVALQETAFKKVIKATMTQNKQHGPVIELNRLQVCVFGLVV